MINFNLIKAVYFVGIGGIGMSALARYFMHRGVYTAGYDRGQTPLTEQLRKEHILVDYTDTTEAIPALFKTYSKNRMLIVYTPAISPDNEVLSYFRDNNYHLYKRAEVLGLITENIPTIAVAGTHGKTSVSVMTAWILRQSKILTDGFFGGISKNFNSNLMLSDSDKKTQLIVAEADEFDRSFLHLNPVTAVVTSLDADHLDIYKNFDYLKESFLKFINQIDKKGTLLIKNTIDLPQNDFPEKVYTYALNASADFYAENIESSQLYTKFDLVSPKGTIKDLRLNIPGILNVDNAVAASALALLHGALEEDIRNGLESWKGTYRRFDYVINRENLVFIDDYAHHPKELEAFIGSIRKLYPDRRITGIFQPHLFSRTRDFADDFAQELSRLDEVILTDIYPAREEPIEGISSQIILDKIRNTNKMFCPKDELPELFTRKQPEVLLLMGAGDISEEKNAIAKALKKNMIS
jgi:UDP-N-acetylmuramate--alanine ligase